MIYSTDQRQMISLSQWKDACHSRWQCHPSLKFLLSLVTHLRSDNVPLRSLIHESEGHSDVIEGQSLRHVLCWLKGQMCLFFMGFSLKCYINAFSVSQGVIVCQGDTGYIVLPHWQGSNVAQFAGKFTTCGKSVLFKPSVKWRCIGLWDQTIYVVSVCVVFWCGDSLACCAVQCNIFNKI